MTTTTTSPNGARAKIMRALIAEGMLTTAELATHTGLRPDQARDNAVQARKDGLVTSERDDVTGLVAYKVTNKGREYCSGIAPALPKATATEALADPTQRHDCASAEQALDLAQKAIARLRDEKICLLTERDEARQEADRLREMAVQMESARDRLHKEFSEWKSAAEESGASVNERFGQYDALVGERSKLVVDITNLHADNDKLRRTISALESRAPTFSEYANRLNSDYIQAAGATREEAIKEAVVVAKEMEQSVRVYGLTLIGAVEIRPVFVGAES